jgi:hypothetical protein
MDNANETAKHVIDGLSVVTVVGTLLDILPAVAAVFTIIWTAIRIYETDTVQRLLGREVSDASED